MYNGTVIVNMYNGTATLYLHTYRLLYKALTACFNMCGDVWSAGRFLQDSQPSVYRAPLYTECH